MKMMILILAAVCCIGSANAAQPPCRDMQEGLLVYAID